MAAVYVQAAGLALEILENDQVFAECAHTQRHLEELAFVRHGLPKSGGGNRRRASHVRRTSGIDPAPR
jgi:hypothetical protein